MGRCSLTKEKIVQKAIELIDTHGVANLTIKAIAADFGVKPPSIYNHISGIEEIRRHLSIAALTACRDELRLAVMGKSGSTALRHFIDAYRAFYFKSPGFFEILSAKIPLEDVQRQKLADETLQIIFAVLDSFGIHGENAIHALRFLRSLLQGFLHLERSLAFQKGCSIEDSYRVLIHTVEHCFSRWSEILEAGEGVGLKNVGVFAAGVSWDELTRAP